MASLSSIPSQFLVQCLLMAFLVSMAFSATFTLRNNCEHTVWPGILSNAGTTALGTTGFELGNGESRSVEAPASWSGRMWGRTRCATEAGTGQFACGTGDCGSGRVECAGGGAAPPATLAEFTLDGSGGMDFYDVSLVDGYNVGMLVVAQGGRGGNCSSTGCLVDLNGLCPSELRVMDGGEGVACRSACEAFGSPQYCCSGAYGNPNTCHPSSYSQLFKNACPRAYSYAYDDATSTFTCAGANYLITFCPTTTTQKSSGDNPEAAGLPLINDTMVFLSGDEDSHAVPRAGVTTIAPLALALLALSWPLLRLF